MTEEITQGELSFFGLERIDRAKPVYHCTSARFRKLHPDLHRIAVELLGAGRHGIRELCRLLHCSHHLLESIEQEQAQTLATLRKKAALENMQLHRLALERAGELLPRCDDLGKVAIASGIFAEKSQLFAGEATARIEHLEPTNLVERFNAFCEQLEKRAQAREIDVSAKDKKQIGDQLEPGISAPTAAAPALSDSKSQPGTDSSQEKEPIPDDLPNETDPSPDSQPSLVARGAPAAPGGGGGWPAAGESASKSISP